MVSSGLNLSLPTIIGWFVDDIMNGSGSEAINGYALALFLVFIGVGIATF